MVSDNGPVLTGWKAIAAFLKRDQRTAMRWASERGLPIRRVPGGKRGSVYAVQAEIAEWLARGAGQPGERTTPVEQRAQAIVGSDRNDAEPFPTTSEGDILVAVLGSGKIYEDAGDCPAPSPAPSTARWSATVLAAALAGAALAAGSIELGLLSIGTAAGGTMTACHGSTVPR